MYRCVLDFLFCLHEQIASQVDVPVIPPPHMCMHMHMCTYIHTHTHRGSIDKLLTGKIYYKNIHILTDIYNYIQNHVMTTNLPIPLYLSLSCTHQFTVNTHITQYSKKKLLTACFHLFCTRVAAPSIAYTLDHQWH